MKFINGNCLNIMKQLDENSIDSIVTDPPYGLSFMGKKWDYDVPSVEIWREALRVLKPGGHLLAFGGTRTYHRLVINIEDAGFEIRDQVQWIYGSGFPKSHNGPWGGTALKPANEPIVLARKPLIGTVAENVDKYGTGGLNIESSRIEGRERINYGLKNVARNNKNVYGADGTSADFDSSKGRWPANVIFDENAATILDKQSGKRKSGGAIKSPKSSTRFKNTHSQTGNQPEWAGYQDSGGASRFFYVAKASKKERGENNNHPTVKPIQLMEYLIRLVTPFGGTVLDPFAGSGSTGVAAQNLGFKFIGIELDPAYCEIAKKRINLP